MPSWSLSQPCFASTSGLLFSPLATAADLDVLMKTRGVHTPAYYCSHTQTIPCCDCDCLIQLVDAHTRSPNPTEHDTDKHGMISERTIFSPIWRKDLVRRVLGATVNLNDDSLSRATTRFQIVLRLLRARGLTSTYLWNTFSARAPLVLIPFGMH
jgi:hypothetical protein